MPFKTAQSFLLSAAAVLALSGCGWLGEDVSSGSYTRWESSAPAAMAATPTPTPPTTRVMQAAQGTWLEPEQGAKPVPTPSEVAALKQANDRIVELEEEVALLRNDMKMMMPALTKLANLPTTTAVTAETLNDIQPAAGSVAAGEIPRVHRNFLQGDEFHDDPEVAMDTSRDLPPAATVAPAPMSSVPEPTPAPRPHTPLPPPAVAPPVPPSAVPAVANGMVPGAPIAIPAAYTPPAINVASIQNVRFGNHDGGKSRMVIDVSAASHFTFDIDNNEKLMVVEIPGTVWSAGPITRQLQDHPLVESMASSPDGQGGTRVVLQLKAPAKVLWSQAIPPAGGQGNRIVIDISSL